MFRQFQIDNARKRRRQMDKKRRRQVLSFNCSVEQLESRQLMDGTGLGFADCPAKPDLDSVSPAKIQPAIHESLLGPGGVVDRNGAAGNVGDLVISPPSSPEGEAFVFFSPPVNSQDEISQEADAPAASLDPQAVDIVMMESTEDDIPASPGDSDELFGSNGDDMYSGAAPAPGPVPPIVTVEDESRLTDEEQAALDRLKDAHGRLVAATEKYDEAINSIKNTDLTLEELEERKKELQDELQSAQDTRDSHNQAAQQSDRDLANEYNERHADAISAGREKVEQAYRDLDQARTSEIPAAKQAIRDALRELHEVAPGDRPIRLGDEFHWRSDGAGRRERADRQRQYHQEQAAAAQAEIDRLEAALNEVCDDIAAIVCAQQAASDFQTAMADFDDAKPAVDTANDRIAGEDAKQSAKDKVLSASKVFDKANAAYQALVDDYLRRREVLEKFADYLGLLSEIADILPENPDPTGALDIGSQLLEASANLFFPNLSDEDVFERNEDGTISTLGLPGRFLPLVEAYNSLVKARAKLDKAVTELENLCPEEDAEDAEDAE